METFIVSFDGDQCRVALSESDDDEIYQNGIKLPKEIKDPSAWFGKEKAANIDEWIYEITESDIEDINKGLKSAKQKFIDKFGEENYEKEGEISDLTENDYNLGAFGQTIERIHSVVVKGQGFHLIRGIPIHKYSRWEVCAIYFMIGLIIGSPVSQNAKGHLLGHVKDLGDDHTRPETRIYRTRYKQRFHVDFCDLVGLLCLQQSKSGGESSIASTVTIYNELRKRAPQAVKLLCQNQFWDRKNEVPPGMKPYYLQPIFNFHKGLMCTIFAPTFIEAAHKRFSDEISEMPEDLAKAIALFEDIAAEVKLDMEFRPGDIQLVNNFSVTHARGTYVDYEDPVKRRHLLRLWLKAKEGRQVPPTYDQFNGILIEGTIPHAPLEAS